MDASVSVATTSTRSRSTVTATVSTIPVITPVIYLDQVSADNPEISRLLAGFQVFVDSSGTNSDEELMEIDL